MDVRNAVAAVDTIQEALKILTALSITAYMWPVKPTVTHGSNYDFIVVGGGSAGCVVANRLTENKDVTVLLIEAGGYPPLESIVPDLLVTLPHSSYDWNYTSVNDNYTAQHMKNQVVSLTAGKVLGGSSSLQHLLHVRGSPHDYDSWAEVAGDSWSYNNILKYFIKSETLYDEEILESPTGSLHGTNGYLGLTRETHEQNLKYLEAFAELGHNIVLDTNSNYTLGYTEPMFNIAHNIRQSGATSYLSPIKNRENLKVLTNTEVTRIMFYGTEAIGVEAIDSNKESINVYANNEVILSAGALSTPKILMLSGIGPQDHLESLHIEVLLDLPVGENLQDHPSAIVIYNLAESNATAKAIDPRQFPAPTTLGYVALDNTQTYPDYQTINLLIPHNSSTLLTFCSVAFSYDDEVCQKIYDISAGKNTMFTVFTLMHPVSRGRFLLKSNNTEDSPLIYTGAYSNETDLDNVAKYLKDFTKIVNTKYFRSLGATVVDIGFKECKDYGFGSLEYWRCYALVMSSTLWHYSSTCSMGSVVDSSLKVIGSKRLRVIDASILPITISGNINAAVVMVAEKAADLIKEYWNIE